MLILYDILNYIGYFFLLLIPLAIAVILAKKERNPWICYILGMFLQGMVLIGGIGVRASLGIDFIIYIVLLLAFGIWIVIINKQNKQSKYIDDTAFSNSTASKDDKNKQSACILKNYRLVDPLEEEADHRAVSRQEQTSNKISCPICHKQNPTDSTFCECCGHRLVSDALSDAQKNASGILNTSRNINTNIPAESTFTPKSLRTSSVWFYVAAILGVLCVILCIECCSLYASNKRYEKEVEILYSNYDILMNKTKSK